MKPLRTLLSNILITLLYNILRIFLWVSYDESFYYYYLL